MTDDTQRPDEQVETLVSLSDYNAANARAERAERDNERLRETVEAVRDFRYWLNLYPNQPARKSLAWTNVVDALEALTAAADETPPIGRDAVTGGDDE